MSVRRTSRFRYIADPVCIACLILYPINRWYFKPHHIGGWFTHGYLNDVICLPIFLPIILYGQRLLGLRRHDGYPRGWEMLQHWAIFSIVFEVILPRMPHLFAHTNDPWNVAAYLAGGVVAEIYWKTRAISLKERGMGGTPVLLQSDMTADPKIHFTLNGHPVTATAGSSVAVAVLANGVTTLRRSVTGEPRGPVCGMGICFECRLMIGGRPHQKSCQIILTPGMVVSTDV